MQDVFAMQGTKSDLLACLEEISEAPAATTMDLDGTVTFSDAEACFLQELQ